MNTNDSPGPATTCDDTYSAFSELKRRVRAVRSRLRRGPTGGRGVDAPATEPTTIESVTSANLNQKEPTPSPVESVTSALTREDRWRSEGQIQAVIYGKSINPRILEILLPTGCRARAIIKPSEHGKFGRHKPVWVKKDENGKHYIVVGAYSQWGVRHA